MLLLLKSSARTRVLCGASWEFGSGTATTSRPLDEIPLFLGYRTADVEMDFFELHESHGVRAGIRFVVSVHLCPAGLPRWVSKGVLLVTSPPSLGLG